MMPKSTILLLLLAGALLSGCGLKGNLYLPPTEPPASERPTTDTDAVQPVEEDKDAGTRS